MGKKIGLVDVVDRGDLYRLDNGTKQTFVPSGFDRAVLDLASESIRRRVPMGLLLPVGGLHTAAILAASMLVRLFMESHELTAKVAVVSKQLALRPYYSSLYITEQRLAEFYPLEIINSSGGVSRAMSSTNSKGRFRFSLNLSRLEALGDRYHGIIIEAGTGTTEEMTRTIEFAYDNDIPLIYLSTDPFDDVLNEIAKTGVVCAWTPEEIAEYVTENYTDSAICADVDVLRNASETCFRVKGPNSQAGLDIVLPLLWDDMQNLQKSRQASFTMGLRWGWAIFAGLSRLPIPVHYYDRQARTAWKTATLEDAPVRASEFAQNSADPNDKELWQVFAEDLTDALDAAYSNCKPAALVDWVIERCEVGQGLMVVQNRAVVAATKEFFDERSGIPLRWQDRITIGTFSDLERGKVPWCAESTLFSGPVPWSRAGLLATPAARELIILTHGPWETDRVVRQIKLTEGKLRKIACGSLRHDAIDRLGSVVPPLCNDYAGIQPNIMHTSIQAPRVPPAAREPVWNPFDIQIVHSLRIEDDADISTDAGLRESNDIGITKALMVDLSDGIGFFDPDLRVSRIREGEEREVAVKSLQHGDILVLVDHGVRTNLFNMIISKLEEVPEFVGIVGLVREWQANAARACQTNDSTLINRDQSCYEMILKAMRARGSSIRTTLTIRNWIHGIVHGPRDPMDIKRLGEVIDNDYLLCRWEAIGKALDTIRNHRKKIGRMLARAIGTVSFDRDAYFDRRLGIHLSELAEAVTYHEVLEISHDIFTVPIPFANILLDLDEANRIMSANQRGQE